jgi:formylglycine-generating enzyme required for sulfatase activity
MMKRASLRISMCVVVVCVFAGSVSADLIQGIDIDFVTIGNPGNAGEQSRLSQGDTDYYGGVDYTYQLGKYEVTNGQWNAFVSAAGAPTGNDGLFDPGDGYDQSATWTGTNVPTNNVSWYEAAQFCNYLTTGDKSQGAYQFSGNHSNPGDFEGIDRDSAILSYGAIYVIPTDNEWYKAAFYKPDGSGYSTYANGMDTVPDEWSPTGGPNSDGQAAGWNYDYAYPDNSSSNDQPWDVTAGYSPEELNGTFDMMGNILEWNEMSIGSTRTVRGGSYISTNDYRLNSNFLAGGVPDIEFYYIGFRVAVVPEPCSLVLLGLGGLVLRRRKA